MTPSPPRPLLVVSGRWAATSPSPTIIHLLYRAVLTRVVRLESVVVSICITRSRGSKSGVQLLVVTIDSRLWTFEIQRTKGCMQPETLVIGRECCLGVCPGVSDCLILENSLILFGPNSECYQAPWPCDRRPMFSSNRHLAGHCLILICISSATSATCISSSGSSHVRVSGDSFCSISNGTDHGSILIEAQRSGQVFITHLGESSCVAQGLSSPRILLDIKEELCGVHFIDYGDLLGVVFVSTFGKIVFHSLNGTRTKHCRVSVIVNCSALSGSRLYLTTEGSLYFVDLLEAVNDPRPCSSAQGIPLALRRSTFQPDSGLVLIRSSGCASNEVVALPSSSQSPSFFEVASDIPVAPVWNCSIKSLMSHIRQLSNAHMKVRAESATLDQDLLAVHFALKLQSSNNINQILSCTFTSTPMMHNGSAAVMLNFSLVNKSSITVPAGSFSMHFSVTYMNELAFKTESLCLPLQEFAPKQVIQTPMVCPLISPLPIKIKASLVYYSQTDISGRFRANRIVELLSSQLDVLNLSSTQPEFYPIVSSKVSATPWISNLLLNEPKPIQRPVQSCKIRLARNEPPNDLFGTISEKMLPTKTSSADTPSTTSVEMMTVSGSRSKLYTVSSQPGLIDLFLHCNPGSSLALWRASLVSLLSEDHSQVLLTHWKTIAMEILPGLQDELFTIEDSIQKALSSVEKMKSGGLRKFLISAEDCSNFAHFTTTTLLLVYEDFRNKISQQLPL